MSRPIRQLIRAALVVILAAGAVLALPAVRAAAQTAGSRYVSPTGVDSGTCSSAAHACLTVAYAIQQGGTTIRMAAGVYDQQLTLRAGVTLAGASESATIIEPESLVANDTDPDTSNPVAAIVDIGGATNLVELKNLTVSGAAAVGSISSCNDEVDGVFANASHLELSHVAVTGLTLPTMKSPCATGNGVVVATPIVQSASTMDSVTVSDFSNDGIVCEDAGTGCSIDVATVTCSGATASVPQIGILMWGDSGAVAHATVSQCTYAPGGAGDNGAGIEVRNAGLVNVTFAHVSYCDTGIELLETSVIPTLPDGQQSEQIWGLVYDHVTYSTDVPGYTLGNPLGADYGDGIALDGTQIANTEVIDDTMNYDPRNGLALYAAFTTLVEMDDANYDGNGFYIGPSPYYNVSGVATGNSVTTDSASHDVNDGVLVDAGAVSNFVEADRFANAGIWDAQDLGTSTGYDANTCTGPHRSTPSNFC